MEIVFKIKIIKIKEKININLMELNWVFDGFLLNRI